MIRKGFVILFVVLIVLLIGTLAFAGDPLFEGVLRRYGPAAVGQPLDFEQANLSILGSSASIDALRIGPEAEPLARVGRFAFDASARDLLSGRLYIEEAALGAAHLNLIIDENGRFTFDPGPPPPEVEPTKPPPAEREQRTPPEDRDIVQIVEELWERYETYKEYYDEYGGVFGGDPETAEEAAKSRAKWPGKPAYLTAQADAAAAAAPGFFWLDAADVSELSWKTLDRRSGKRILPEIAHGTLQLENLGSTSLARREAGESTLGPATVHLAADFVEKGGKLRFSLEMPHEPGWNTLGLELIDLPVSSLRDAVNRSLPYELRDGIADLITEGLRFTDEALEGRVRVQLRGATLAPKAGSPEVLGVKPAEFCKVMNRALTEAPIAFDFVLGGTPTDPKFTIENATDLDDLIVDAVRAEAEARIQEEVDEAKAELEKKAGEKIGEKAEELLGGRKIPGLGGGKKKKDDGGGR